MKRSSVSESESANKIQRCETPQILEEAAPLESQNNEEPFRHLPLELKLQIVSHLGSDVYASVTGDDDGAIILMLKEHKYKKYFESRPFDYCPDKDVKLARHCNTAQVSRLPMLALRQFQTYFESQADDYIMADDPLLRMFFRGTANIALLPLLVDGRFDDYKQRQADDYDAASDRLLLTYLDTTPQKVSQCLERLVEFDKNLKRVGTAPGVGGKIIMMCVLGTIPLYEYLLSMDITVPDCIRPLNLIKTLSYLTQIMEFFTLEIQRFCDMCGERSLAPETGMPILERGSWEDMRVIVFCRRCAACLLRIPNDNTL
jgi:hypothetical protein